MAVDPIASLKLTPPSGPAGPANAGNNGDSTGFGDALHRLIGTVDASAGEANDAVSRMLQGTGDVHEAMIAMQQADTMLQLTVQIRNKLVQAYQDIMRMPT
jgi:flagellar hook-basal body complex protein FliE